MNMDWLEEAKRTLREIKSIKEQRDFKQEGLAKAYFTEKYGELLTEKVQELESENNKLIKNLIACSKRHNEKHEWAVYQAKQNKQQRKAIERALELLNGTPAEKYEVAMAYMELAKALESDK